MRERGERQLALLFAGGVPSKVGIIIGLPPSPHRHRSFSLGMRQLGPAYSPLSVGLDELAWWAHKGR